MVGRVNHFQLAGQKGCCDRFIRCLICGGKTIEVVDTVTDVHLGGYVMVLNQGTGTFLVGRVSHKGDSCDLDTLLRLHHFSHITPDCGSKEESK